MKIGYDAKRAAANFTGLGNYSRYVIDGVADSDLFNEIYLYTPRNSDNKEYKALLNHNNVYECLPTRVLARTFSSLWRSFTIHKQIKANQIEIYHGLSNELPFTIKRSNTKSIVTIHDLIFLRLPDCYKFMDRVIYNKKFKAACLNADKIIAVSECTKRDIIHFYGIKPDKIEVIYQGCNKVFKATSNELQKKEVRKSYNLPEKFILNVGTLEKRKNLFLIVQSLKNLPEDIHLVAVGRRTKYSDMVMRYAERNNLTNRIHLLHNVAFSHLPTIYQCSELFAYPSFYEGFGIPVIEAINSKIPVVAAKGSCLEEAGGEGALYVNPNSVQEFSDAIKLLLSDKDFKENLISKGSAYIKKFEDGILAEQMMQFYKRLLLGS